MRLLHFAGCQLRARGCNRLMQADQVHQAQNAGEKSVSPSRFAGSEYPSRGRSPTFSVKTAFPNGVTASATPLTRGAHSALSGREQCCVWTRRIHPHLPHRPKRLWAFQWRRLMTALKILPAGLIATVLLTMPVRARDMNERYAAESALCKRCPFRTKHHGHFWTPAPSVRASNQPDGVCDHGDDPGIC